MRFFSRGGDEKKKMEEGSERRDSLQNRSEDARLVTASSNDNRSNKDNKTVAAAVSPPSSPDSTRGGVGGGGGVSPSRRQRRTSSSRRHDPKKAGIPKAQGSVTWQQAHRTTCLEQNTLCPSIQDLMDQGGFLEMSNQPDYYASDVLLWGERPKATREILQKFQQRQGIITTTHNNDSNNDRNATTSTVEFMTPPRNNNQSNSSFLSGSLFSKAVNVAMMPFDLLTSPFAGAEEPDDYADVLLLTPLAAETRHKDDNQQKDRVPVAPPNVWVGRKEPILNIELTLSCLEFIKSSVRKSPPLILAISDQPSSLQEWISKQEQPKQQQQQQQAWSISEFLAQLPQDQILFLLDVLVAAGVVQKITRQQELGKPDLIVFPDSTLPSSSSSVDVRLAVYDLQVAMDHLHIRNETLEHEAVTAVRQAKLCRKNGQIKAGLHHVSRKKRLQQQIDINYAHLQNLESQQLALQQAADTQRLQRAMEQTAQTLKQMRQEKQQLALQEQKNARVQELVDDLRLELEHVEEDNLALNLTSDNNITDDFDEDELLQELASYPDPDPNMDGNGDGEKSKRNNKRNHHNKKNKAKEEEEEDIDIDELLEQVEALQIDPYIPMLPSSAKNKKNMEAAAAAVATSTPKTTPRKKTNAKPLPPSATRTIPVSVYGGDTTVTRDATAADKVSMKRTPSKGQKQQEQQQQVIASAVDWSTATTKQKDRSSSSSSSAQQHVADHKKASSSRKLASAVLL